MSSRIRSLLFLLAYLAIVYNLDKFNLLLNTSLNLHTVLYLVITIAVLCLIAIPGSIKLPMWAYLAGWCVVYLAARWIIYPASPLWLGANITVTLLEIALLVIAVILAYYLAKQLHKVDELFEKIVLPTSDPQVRNMNAAIKDIEIEFSRSRRYKHPLSLMVLEPSKYTLDEDLDRIIMENQKKISHRYLTSKLAEVIVRQVLRTDMVITKDWDGHFIIVCPENNAEGTSILAQRIREDVKTNLGVSIQYGIAAFPADALTLEELFQHAENNLAQDGQITQISASAKERPADSD
jgi:GGDEF domain-containing protein